MAIIVLIMVAKLNHIIEYFFVGLLILWVGIKVRSRDFHFVRTPLDLPIFFFVAWILATSPFAFDPSYSFAECRKTVLQILMFYFVVNVVNTESQVRKILSAFLVGVVLLSIVGIAEYLWRGHSFFDRHSHADSLAASGQWFSSYLVMGVPFLWLFFQDSTERKTIFFICIFLMLVLIALFFSHQRAAWLAFITQLAVLWIVFVRSKRVRWGLLATAFGLIFIGGQLYRENRDEIFQGVALSSFQSMNYRLDTWKLGFDQILANPLMGYGYGNHTFQKINEEVVIASANSLFTELHLHNAFLSLAFEVGLIGFGLFAFIYSIIIKTAYHGAKNLRGTFVGNLGLCIILLVIGVVTRNVFDNMLVGTLSYLFWLLIGLYFALHVSSQSDGFEEKIILGKLKVNS